MHITLVGAGNMGGAMLEGWLSADTPAITVVDPGLPEERREVFEARGVSFSAPARTDLLILAVKPQIMSEVLPKVAPLARDDTTVLSVAAGITIATLRDTFGSAAPIVRAMPNTPSQVGRGITVCCPTENVTQPARDHVTDLMLAVGQVEWITDETLMDAVTGVSGSGPAYVFALTEALAQAGEEAGLPADLAARLARATVSGAGELMHRSKLDPAELRRNVTSPGGTTEAALEILLAEYPDLLVRAVAASAARSKELS